MVLGTAHETKSCERGARDWQGGHALRYQLTMDDAEEQSMELEAIKSIYGEDAIIKASSQAYSLELSVELAVRCWGGRLVRARR